MIFILHGGDTSSSREYILKLQKEKNVGLKKEFSILDVEPLEIRDMFSTLDMFGDVLMVVLDVSKAGRMKVDEYVEAFLSAPDDVVLVILSSKVLTKSNGFIKGSKKMGAKTILFKDSPKSNVFKFVDSVFSGDRKKSYSELRKLELLGEDSIYLLSMLVYGLRNISYVKFSSPARNSLPPFVRSKAESQSSAFSKRDLLRLYGFFYQLDKSVKLSKIPTDVAVPFAVEKVLTFV